MSVSAEVHGQTLVVRMTRADKRNAINAAMAVGISDALDRLDDDEGLRVGVLTGTKQIFCAGTDLADGAVASTERGGEYGLIRRKRAKPLIAAVEGPCLGGGLEIALSCDVIVASTTAHFAFPEPKLGLLPALGGLFRVRHALPLNIARELLITARGLNAERAYAVGFVNQLTEPERALAEALVLAEEAYVNAPTAVREILAAFYAYNDSAEESGWRLSEDALRRVLTSGDAAEGIAAFFAKRPPIWADRGQTTD